MTKEYTMLSGQSLFDLALLLYGDITQVFKIIDDNSELDNIHSGYPGLVITYTEQSLSLTEHFKNNGIDLVSGFPEIGGVIVPPTPPLLLLDAFPGASSALDVAFLLSEGYVGQAISVREDGGDTVLDIPFTGGVLDQAALLAHCGSNSGFVHTVYDQSGNGRDWTSTVEVSQPRIVNSGVVEVDSNDTPRMFLDASNDYIQSDVPNSTDLWVFQVSNISDNEYIIYTGDYTGGGSKYSGVIEDGNAAAFNPSNFGTPTWYANGVLATMTTRDDAHTATSGNKLVTIAGAETSVNNWSNQFRFSGYGGGFNIGGYLQSVITYDGDMSSDRAAIEVLINSKYEIY